LPADPFFLHMEGGKKKEGLRAVSLKREGEKRKSLGALRGLETERGEGKKRRGGPTSLGRKGKGEVGDIEV